MGELKLEVLESSPENERRERDRRRRVEEEPAVRRAEEEEGEEAEVGDGYRQAARGRDGGWFQGW